MMPNTIAIGISMMEDFDGIVLMNNENNYDGVVVIDDVNATHSAIVYAMSNNKSLNKSSNSMPLAVTLPSEGGTTERELNISSKMHSLCAYSWRGTHSA